MKYKVCINIKKNTYITVEICYKCTRHVRPVPFYRTETRRFFPDRLILIKRSLHMILTQNKHCVVHKLEIYATIPRIFNKYTQNAEKAIANIVLKVISRSIVFLKITTAHHGKK